MGTIKHDWAATGPVSSTDSWTRTVDNMKILVFSLLLAVCSASPAPQYGGSAHRCSNAYTTEKHIEYQERKRQECKTIEEPYKDKECKQVHKVVPERYTETVCDMGNERHCIKTWQLDEYGNKVWIENPNECQEFGTNQCHDEERTHNVVKYEDQCRVVTLYRPKKSCHEVHENVPVQVTRRVSKKVCAPH